jgi:hypothetical protein
MRTRIRAAASAAVVALAAATALFNGAPGAIAGNGDAVIAGQINTATFGTSIQNTFISNPCTTVAFAGLSGCGDPGLRGVTSGTSGVEGENQGLGNGVYGHANNSAASGVYGQNDGTGFGVAGRANQGTGVLADSTNGIALSVTGKAKFSRSGRVTISYPNKSATVTGVPVTAKSLAFATLQKFLAGQYVVAAVPKLSGSSNSFTIYLNKAPGSSTNPQSVVVGWQVIERP